MPIGIFDSGYGGLTILKEIRKLLPQYDYIYLGDNARNPYGTRSFDIVYEFTLEAVKALFNRGCDLVILACNTASAKALRTIQQKDLPMIAPDKRVLGVIRPTVEKVSEISKTGHVGLLATQGTVASHSYLLELEKISPNIRLTEHACPMWVPLVENDEYASPGADYFIKKDLDILFNEDKEIDTVILGCTHYPLLLNKITKYIGSDKNIISQGSIVAESLKDYLRRHPEIESKCSKGGSVQYLTTEQPEKFSLMASLFMQGSVNARHVTITEDKCREVSLDEIKKMLPEEALRFLNNIIEKNPDNEEALTLRGMKYWALGKRSAAIKDYLAAIKINPDGKAKMVLESANRILDYYNKDLLNP